MTIKQRAIKHYDTMIEWAKKQPPEERSNCDIMKKNIKQEWHGDFCPYCKKHIYGNKCKLSSSTDKMCPEDDYSGGECCDGLWLSMNCSITWREWLKYAKQVRKYIEKNG